MDYIISILPQMWLGPIETLKLFFITIVLSIPLGILLWQGFRHLAACAVPLVSMSGCCAVRR